MRAVSYTHLGEAKQDSLEARGLLQTGENAKAVAALLQQQLTLPTPHDAVRERFQHWLAPRLGGSARCAQKMCIRDRRNTVQALFFKIRRFPPGGAPSARPPRQSEILGR